MLVVALGMTCQSVRSADTPHASDAAVEAQCRPYFHDACSEAMGRWLPSFGSSIDWWDHATRITKRDGFIYCPHDGTRFVYETAGTRGRAVYDPRASHSILPARVPFVERRRRCRRRTHAAEAFGVARPSERRYRARNPVMADGGIAT
jgi:hypothetical protein